MMTDKDIEAEFARAMAEARAMVAATGREFLAELEAGTYVVQRPAIDFDQVEAAQRAAAGHAQRRRQEAIYRHGWLALANPSLAAQRRAPN